jgi:hypothetical protein
MKKLLLVVGATILLTSCVNNPSSSSLSSIVSSDNSSTSSSTVVDNIAPILQIDPLEVTIKFGEDYDLLTGVLAVDDVDGDVRDLVQINSLDFNKDKAGTYTVIYVAKDKSGNTSSIIQRKITVLPKEPTIDEIGYSKQSVYTDVIAGEVSQPTSTPSCFPGAWYRKVVSTKDQWLGIEGTIQLPTYEFDENRYDAKNNRYLDNPSIYMGGNAGYESDVGLSLSVGCTDQSNCNYNTINGKFFRPFWRYISDDTTQGKFDGYSISCTGSNCFANADFTKTEYYYLPGDVLRMSVFVVEPNYMRLKIEVIQASTLPEAIAIRQKINQPKTFVSPKFKSNGQGVVYSEFKRVNAIDQVNNENKPTVLTGTKILNAIWFESYLYRKINGEVYKVPFTERRASYMACPISGSGSSSYPHDAYTIDYPEGVSKALGGELISIHPKGINFSN